MPVTEAQLLRQCAPLHPTIAIEAFSGLVMGLLFLYLWLKVSTRNDLRSPVYACLRVTSYSFTRALADLKMHMDRWSEMSKATMGERFAFCRKANQAILLFQAAVAFISITRWLHIGNINGFRYLGYAITCPPMQAELVLLISPVVPCYKLCAVFTYVITFCMLIAGWAASTSSEPLFNCDWNGLTNLEDDCFHFTRKFWMLTPAVCIQLFLSFVQIPYLGFVYMIRGGGSNPMLPPGYLKLLAIVALTWLGFPLWWFVSYEGMGLLEDTKLNCAGFALLNVISKGALAFQVIQMTKDYRKSQAERGDRSAARELGMTRPRSGSTDSLDCSTDSMNPIPVINYNDANSVTAWIVRFLKNFDTGAPGVPPSAMSVPVPGTKDYGAQQGYQYTDAHAYKSTGSYAGGDPLMSSIKIWEDLEPMYRRFLKDSGIQPTEFARINLTEKAELRSRFDTTANAVLVDLNGKPNRGMPQWCGPGSVTLTEATDEEILTEMQRRLKAGGSEKPVHPRTQSNFDELVTPRAPRMFADAPEIEDDSSDLGETTPDLEVDANTPPLHRRGESAPGHRRGYHV